MSHLQEMGHWPLDDSRVADLHNPITMARSLKESKLYCKVRDNKKSIDLLTRRVGASFNKNALEVRIYMDAPMIKMAKEVNPDGDPLDLLNRAKSILLESCVGRAMLTKAPLVFDDILRSKDGQYGYLTLAFKPDRSIPKILRYVLMAEMMWCIDDALVELDLQDGVYR